MSMSRTARGVLIICLVAAVLLVAIELFLHFNTSTMTSGGPFATGGLPPGIGPQWTNSMTGQVGGPDFESVYIPFESAQGCGSENYTSSISWRRGWYVQNWTGPRGMINGTYRELAALPDGAVYTGWEREGERLWVVPKEKSSPDSYTFLYVERTDHVERWPQATFGCA